MYRYTRAESCRKYGVESFIYTSSSEIYNFRCCVATGDNIVELLITWEILTSCQFLFEAILNWKSALPCSLFAFLGRPSSILTPIIKFHPFCREGTFVFFASYILYREIHSWAELCRFAFRFSFTAWYSETRIPTPHFAGRKGKDYDLKCINFHRSVLASDCEDGERWYKGIPYVFVKLNSSSKFWVLPVQV